MSRLLPFALLAATFAAPSARAQTVVDLWASETSQFDRFAWDLAVMGDLLIVGAPSNIGVDCEARCGTVHVFRDTGAGPFAGYEEEATLEPSPVVPFGQTQYGSAVAACEVPGGDTFVLGGAPYEPLPNPVPPMEPFTFVGAAYVHRRDAATGTWHRDARLVRPDAGEGDYDGAAVALACSRDAGGEPLVEAIVWAEGFDIWHRDGDAAAGGGVWSRGQTIGTASSFPNRVALDAVVASPPGPRGDGPALATPNGPESVGVYRRTGPDETPWELEATLSSPLTEPADIYGAGLDIDGDLLVVGSQYEPADPPYEGGRVHVYRYTSTGPFGGWEEETVLTPAVPRDRFGAMTTVWAGSNGDGVGARISVGSALGVNTFSRSADGTWREEQLFEHPSDDGEWGGILLGMDERLLYYSDPFDDARGTRAGTVHLLDAAWAVAGEAPPSASEATLEVAGPNPSRGRTALAVSLPSAAAVRVELVDGRGRRLAVLHDGALPAGRSRLDVPTAGLPAGVYHVRLSGAEASATVPLTVLR